MTKYLVRYSKVLHIFKTKVLFKSEVIVKGAKNFFKHPPRQEWSTCLPVRSIFFNVLRLALGKSLSDKWFILKVTTKK